MNSAFRGQRSSCRHRLPIGAPGDLPPAWRVHSATGGAKCDSRCWLGEGGQKWPAPGSEDTELGVLMELEVGHGETEVHAGVKLEAVRLIKDRGVSYVQAS